MRSVMFVLVLTLQLLARPARADPVRGYSRWQSDHLTGSSVTEMIALPPRADPNRGLTPWSINQPGVSLILVVASPVGVDSNRGPALWSFNQLDAYSGMSLNQLLASLSQVEPIRGSADWWWLSDHLEANTGNSLNNQNGKDLRSWDGARDTDRVLSESSSGSEPSAILSLVLLLAATLFFQRRRVPII